MKQISKFFAVGLVFLSFLSCQDGKIDTMEGTNKHSSERIQASITISTPTTLTSGTYDVITINNGGSLSVPNGSVSCNSLVNNTTTGTPTIEIGATASFTAYNTDIKKMSIINWGTWQSNSFTSSNSGATVQNYGWWKINIHMYWDAGQFNNYYEMNITDINPWYMTPDLEVNGGNINFYYCSVLNANTLKIFTSNPITGQGRIKVTYSFYLTNPLTTSSQIKYCGTPSGSGGVGSAYASCTTTCP